MADWFTESSESDTRTSYPLTKRLWEGATSACESVVIADSPVFGRMLFLDGELQSASADEHLYHEALVHPVMASSRKKDHILVVGGGEGATVREVLKWNPGHVDWVDIDGELVALCEEHLKWAPNVRSDPKVTCYLTDIRIVLPRLCSSYDVIILDLPDPDGDTGYLYSDEFMSDIRAHLAPGGHIVTHCGPVRPFGSIGEGFQRLRPQFGVEGFYSQMIPSFQSEWGFLRWSPAASDSIIHNTLPSGLRLVDLNQLITWSSQTQSKLWSLLL